jgi:photosystem II stability/assembly factor-like uncharacterized protein
MKTKQVLFVATALFALIFCSISQIQAQSLDNQGKSSYKTWFWDNGINPESYHKKFTQYYGEKFNPKQDQLLATDKWEPLGPTYVSLPGNSKIVFQGRIRSFKWFEDQDKGWVAYLGTCSGGLWYGEFNVLVRDWYSIGDNLPNQSVGAFDMLPGDGSKILVGTGDWARFTGAGVYATYDRGETWTKRYIYDENNDEVTPAAITDLFFVPQSVFKDVVLSSNIGFFKSTDGGVSWFRKTIVSNKPHLGIFDLVIHPTDPKIMYAALPGYGIYKTTDGGEAWTYKSNGMVISGGNNGTTLAIDISKSNPQILYAAPTNEDNAGRGIFKTTDGGNSWKYYSTPAYMVNGQGFHTNVIRIHPTNPNICYAGSVKFIATTDGGENWEERDPGHADLTTFGFSPANPSVLTIGNDGGIYTYNETSKSVLNYNEVFHPNSPTQSYEIDVADSESTFLVAGTQDNGTMVSTNGSKATHWESIYGCDGADNINIHPDNSSLIFYNSWCGSINPRLRSSNKGLASDEISQGLEQVYYCPLRMNKNNTNYIFTTDKNNLYYSSDEGNSWTHASNESGNDFTQYETPRGIAVSQGSNTNEIFVYVWFWNSKDITGVAGKIKVFSGELGKMTKNLVNIPDGKALMRVISDKFDTHRAYALSGIEPYNMYFTTNGGSNWISFRDAINDVMKYDIKRHKNNEDTYFAGTDLGVFKTDDGGDSWFTYQAGLPIVPVMSMAYVSGNQFDTLKIATFGRGYWMRALGANESEFEVHQVEANLNKITHTYGLLDKKHNIVMAGDNGKYLASYDLCETNKVYTTLSENDLYGCDFISQSLDATAFIIFSTNSGKILRKKSGDLIWTTFLTPTTSSIYDLVVNSSNDIMACSGGGLIINTSDMGKNWGTMHYNSLSQYQAVSKLDKNTFIACGSKIVGKTQKPSIVYSTDSGINWVQVPTFTVYTNYKGVLHDLARIDDYQMYAVGNWSEIGQSRTKGVFCKSTNKGQNWEIVTMKLQENMNACCFVDEFDGWACGSNGYVVHTTDKGETWEQMTTGTTADLNDIILIDGYLLVCGDGVVLKKKVIETSVEEQKTVISNIHSIKILPNPSSEQCQVHYSVSALARISIQLYSAQGFLMKTIPSTMQTKGDYQFKINSSEFASGVYFLKISDAKSTTCTRVIINK